MSDQVVYLPGGSSVPVWAVYTIVCALIIVILLCVIVVLGGKERRESQKKWERKQIEREVRASMAAEMYDALEDARKKHGRTGKPFIDDEYESTESYKKVDKMVEKNPEHAVNGMKRWLRGGEHDR